MARVKRGKTTRQRHKNLIAQAKGYRHRRKNVFKLAKQAVRRAKEHAYKSRKIKKRNFRSLWIIRLNAACQKYGIKYSKFINLLRKKNIKQSRKELSELAQKSPEEFKKIVEKVTTTH